MKDLSLKAIIVSLVVGKVAAMATSMIYSYSWIALAELKLITSRQPAFIGWTLIALFFTFLSGYVCAHLAKSEKCFSAGHYYDHLLRRSADITSSDSVRLDENHCVVCIYPSDLRRR
jgi:polyferredoxin